MVDVHMTSGTPNTSKQENPWKFHSSGQLEFHKNVHIINMLQMRMHFI